VVVLSDWVKRMENGGKRKKTPMKTKSGENKGGNEVNVEKEGGSEGEREGDFYNDYPEESECEGVDEYCF
jgi:hypothetical protein